MFEVDDELAWFLMTFSSDELSPFYWLYSVQSLAGWDKKRPFITCNEYFEGINKYE